MLRWIRRMRRDSRVRDESGQSLIEFALVTPLLLLIVVGIIDFGRAWQLHQVMTNAAREGARAAVVDDPALQGQPGVIEQRIRDALTLNGFDASLATIEGQATWDGATGTQAQVTISYPYTFSMVQPFAMWTTDEASLTLRTSSVMRNE